MTVFVLIAIYFVAVASLLGFITIGLMIIELLTN